MRTFREYLKNEGLFDGIKGAFQGAKQGFQQGYSKPAPAPAPAPTPKPVVSGSQPQSTPQAQPQAQPQEKHFWQDTPLEPFFLELLSINKQFRGEQWLRTINIATKKMMGGINAKSVLQLYTDLMKPPLLTPTHYDESYPIGDWIKQDNESGQKARQDLISLVKNYGYKLYQPVRREGEEFDWIMPVNPARTKEIDHIISPGLFDAKNRLVLPAIVRMR